MRKNDPISVLFAASVTALAFWICAGIVAPALSFMFLLLGAAPAQLSGLVAKSDHGMIFAMIVPICAAALGFFNGAFIAFAYNVFIADSRTLKATSAHGQKEPTRLFPVPVSASYGLAKLIMESQPALARSHAAGR